jgi:hypothetical protein
MFCHCFQINVGPISKKDKRQLTLVLPTFYSDQGGFCGTED